VLKVVIVEGYSNLLFVHAFNSRNLFWTYVPSSFFLNSTSKGKMCLCKKRNKTSFIIEVSILNLVD